MKIVHFADFHLGHEAYGKIEPKSGLSSRVLDFLQTLDRIVEYVQKEKIDLVLFAGDAYKTRDPGLTYQRELGRRIKKMAGFAPVVLITGNHDIPPSLGHADTLEIFPTLDVPNVYVFSKPTIKEIANVQILALPWIHRSAILEERERKLPKEKMLRILEKKISEIFQQLLNQVNPRKIAIAVIHQTLSGAVFPSGQSGYIGGDPVIPISVFSDPRLSYVAVGHIHKFQVLNDNPPIIYSGSVERIDFGEEKEEKGFVLVEINEQTKKAKWKFVTLPVRKFKTITIEIPKETSNPNDYVLKKIKKEEIKDAIVRIEISGPAFLLAQLADQDIKKALSSAFYITSIIKKDEEQTKVVLPEPEELAPIEWLKKYLEVKKFKKEEADLIQEEAEKIFEEII